MIRLLINWIIFEFNLKNFLIIKIKKKVEFFGVINI